MSTFLIDIDNTIASTHGTDYKHSRPKPHMIEKVNKLFEKGHVIKIFTGRGSTSGIDWREFTLDQLKGWGVKFHELHMGKPSGDYFVDDKTMSIQDFLRF